jgi:transposase InsO family protein
VAKYSIRAPRRKAKSFNTTQFVSQTSYTNLIKDLEITEPYQALRTDLTCIKYQGKFIYLGTVKDIFTREILSANLSDKHDSVLATFIAIIKAHSATASVEKPRKFITGIPRFLASVVSIQEKKVICRQTA